MKTRLLKKILAIGLTLTAGSALAAGELHIYNWGNYTNP
jgi:spermidine/putrescine-binding protein